MKRPLLFLLTSLLLIVGLNVDAQTSVFNWDVDNPHYIQPVDAGSFNISYFDEDGLTPNIATGMSAGSFDILIDGIGTNDILICTSWFSPAGQADNWLVFGPITHPSNVSSIFSWEHAMQTNLIRDGYEVLVTNVGPNPADFSGATVIKSYVDDDPLTDGHDALTPQSASIPAAFLGGPVYIAIHHNANNQYGLVFDNFDVTQTVTGTAPTADFSANFTTTTAGGSVDFTDLSTDNPTQWDWTFTGASTPTSTAQNPSNIVYPTAGCYEVSLTATNAFGNDTETKTCYINVGNAPAADFSANFTTITAGGSVDFTDLSTDNPNQWAWTFTGASTPSSTVQNPTGIIYPTVGCYEVELTATNTFGNDTETKTCYINVTAAGSAPVADFSGTPVAIQPGGSVDFTDLSTNIPTGWAWTFTGASTASSSSQHPTNIVYPTMGCYEVSLTVNNAFGNDTETKTCYIDVTCPTISAGFTWVDNQNGTVQFTNTSVGMESYDWDFGDSQNSTATDPLHTYAAGQGTFTVVLTGTDSDCSGSTDVSTQTVTVTDTANSINDLEQLYQVAVYPNPSNGQFTVDFEVSTSKVIGLKVFNSIGAEVVNENFGKISGPYTSQVDLTTMPKGVYLMQLLIDNQTISKQVVVR